MFIQILFALLAGILTIGAPCILPLLPILLGTSIGQTSKARPLYIVSGFVIVFAVLGLFLSFLTTHLGFNSNTLRDIAIVLLGVFGLLMLWPTPFEALTMRLGGAIDEASKIGGARKDNLGGFILGMTLGIIWTPCAGPVLGAILTLIATQHNLSRAGVLLLAYAVGAGVPMLVIAYGSQVITTKVRAIAKYSHQLQQVFGVLIILLAVGMYFQLDVKAETYLANFFPNINLETKLTQTTKPETVNQNSMQTIQLQNLGAAPDFENISRWLNSDPLTMLNLRGKVVLIDFWTFSCINCIRTLPYVTKWYDTYKNQGLVVVGVHTPEFDFEKDTNNVADAIKRFKINYPVAQDNDFRTWNAYQNEYWPAEYLIDQKGNIVYTHFGEGEYDHTEDAIRELLGMNSPVAVDNGQNLSGVQSPEMYFGTYRLQNLSSQQTVALTPHDYTYPQNLNLNEFALSGSWQFDQGQLESTGANAKIKLHFSSGKVFMVAASPKQPTTLKIWVDGKPQPDVTVSGSELYTLFDSDDYSDHTIEIQVPDTGFQAFTFTFG